VHSNNMSDMGGLRKKMPITFWTMLIGALALAGIFPFAGFWSKDELLVVASETHHWWMFAAFLITAALTAFYTARMIMLTFGGEYRGEAHLHESPPSMTGPLVTLAGVTVFVGLLGSPQFGSVFGKWVFFELIEVSKFVPWIALLSTVLAVGAIFLGYSLYKTYQARDPMQARLGPLWNVFQHRYYIDSFYMRDIVLPVRDQLSAGVYWFNQNVLDAIVNGAAGFARLFSRAISWFDRNVIDGFINGIGDAIGEAGGFLKFIQSGNVQWYAAGLFVGVAAMAIVFIRIA
jgi:NADH-quinone oxidoreductase subunit L